MRVKIIAWFFVPTALILVAVALVNFYAYQDVTEDLVIERDQDLTRLSASQLATGLTEYTVLLTDIGRTVAVSQNDPAAQQDALERASRDLVVFDGGVFVLDTFGTVVAAEPEHSELLGQDWSDRSYFRQMIRFPEPIFSNILTDGSQEAEIIITAVPINGDQNEFLGSVVGMFRLSPAAVSAFYGGIVRLRIGGSGSTYLVDGDGRVIYHSDTDRIGADFSSQPVVQQVLAGQVSAIRTRDFEGGDIVAGFAPVPGTPWGLITEERWSVLIRESRDHQRFLILLLALGAAVPVLFVAIGLRRIMRPVEALISAARQVARGNFSQTITARSGDEIEELANEFNLMAAQLQESYANLEQKVAARTEELGRSEERYRTLFEDSRDAIFVSLQSEIVAANQAALDLFGFTREAAIGSDVEDRYVDPDDRERFREKVAEKGSVRDFEVKLRKRDGTVMDCLLTATVRLATNGDGGRLVQGIVRDGTERKQAEEALQQSEERFRRLMENAADAFLVVDPDGGLADVNQMACEQFGYSRDELITLSISDVYASLNSVTISDVYDGLVSDGVPVTLEGIGRRKDGTSFPIEAR